MLKAFPLTLAQANVLVAKMHRHHKPVRGHRFSIGVCTDHGHVCGACIVGRPVAREIPAYEVAEITRLVTDGTRNSCSFLLASAARAAAAMGFQWIQTYTLVSEGGASLRAAGWTCDGVTRPSGGQWTNRMGRRNDQPSEPKVRWRKHLSKEVS